MTYTVEPRDVVTEDVGPYRRFIFRDQFGGVWEDVVWCADQHPRPTTPTHLVVDRPQDHS
jgi:hypothetical protein